MQPFSPYTIQRLNITDITQASIPAGNAICYMWWRDVPLGHIWIDGSTSLSIEAFKEKILESVRPAIDYYYSLNNKTATGEWAAYFLNGANEQLEVFLDKYLGQIPLSALPARNEHISIVICTRNRAQFLEQCIKAIMNNTDTNFELVVVDNAPDDDSTKQVVSRFPIAKYVCEPRKGLDIARNTGAMNAAYSIIAYTDDDVIVDKEWISKIKKCFSDPLVMSVTGQVIPVELKTRTQYIFEKYWGFNKGYKPVIFDHKYFMDHVDYGVPVWNIGAGANMAFRREIFDLVGWFDERLDVGAAGCSGDSEFWYRILAEGWNCYYCPQLYVYHNHRDTEQALENQVFHYMRGQVASLFVQYENYGHKGNLKRIRTILPRYYMERYIRRYRKGYTEDFSTINTEIKGYLSGISFYRSVKNNKRKDVLVPNPTLSSPAIVYAHTLVSVIITCYNYGKYLQQAIDSVIAQTYKNIEIIVVDDSSADNTQEIIKKYPGVKSVITHRVEVSAARNIGVQLSTGKLLVFLDADDYLYPAAIALNHSFFMAYPECAFISGFYDKVNETGELLPTPLPQQHFGNNYKQLLEGNYIGMLGNVMYRRDVFFSFHFDAQLPYCEDYDLNLRISKYFPSFSHKEKIIAYRQHNNNKSEQKKRMYAAVKKVLNSHYLQAEQPEIKKAIENGLANWKKHYR